MGLKYYLNLFKKDSNNEAVKLRYYLNIFVFLVYMVLSTVFFSLRNTDIVASSVFGVLAFLVVIFYRILNISFLRLIDKLISEEILNEQDETDAAFIAYRKGYAEFGESNRKLNRILFPLNILLAAVFIGFLPVTIILNLTGNAALAEKIFTITSIAAIIYLAGIFVLSIIFGRKGLWYQNYVDELEIINKYKAVNSDNVINFKIVEDKKQDKQLEYIFPETALRTRFKKLQKINAILCFFLGAILGVAIILLSNLTELFGIDEDTAGIITAVVFYGIIALLITIPTIIIIRQNKIIKEQYLILKTDETTNFLYIKLHELKTPFMKRWNILFPVCFFGSIISNILFASVLSAIIKTDNYGWIFFLLFVAEVIALFIIYFKSYGKARLKMIPIENEIDRIAQEANYVYPDLHL